MPDKPHCHAAKPSPVPSDAGLTPMPDPRTAERRADAHA